jgi:hypothetical protein
MKRREVLGNGLALPWLRRLVTGLSPRRPGFARGSVHVGYVADKFALGQVFSELFDYPLSISFHRHPPYPYITWRMNNRPTGVRSSET